nr:copper-translocating P-type ATPase [Oceanithermus sp.]
MKDHQHDDAAHKEHAHAQPTGEHAGHKGHDAAAPADHADHTGHEGHEGHGAQADHAGHGEHGEHGDHGGHDKHAGHDPEMFRRRFWLSLVLTVPILYFSPQLQAWLGYTAWDVAWGRWVGPVLGSILYFYGGGPFLEGAVREFRHRVPGMMSLIALAISVAYAYSLAVSFGFPGKPFYWELATLIDVMLLGHWIEMKSVQQAQGALEALAKLMPTTAHRVVGEKVEDVPVGELREGDVIMVLPGEQVPADGVIVSGRTTLNEAFLTGESKPVEKQAGDEVVAAAINNDGVIQVKVTRTGEATTLSQIMRLVKEAQQARSRFQALADRAASWLFYVAVVVGSGAFGVWLALGQPFDFALGVAVTTLVIACPHALGLAIPLVNVNATALAAKNGVLVRNREAFERARDIRVVAFDKTGTLTEGRFAVSRVAAAAVTEDELLALAAAIERQSSHPLADAIVEAAEGRGVQLPAADEVQAVPGQGVVGTIDGRKVYVGRPEWTGEFGLELDPVRAAVATAEERGESLIVVFEEGRVLGALALADRVRDSARTAVARLQEMGVEPVMITGDAEAVAQAVAGDLGIRRYYARVMPQDKARIVRELKQMGHVAFVGDGINDAPALVEADLGVAIGAGTNVAIESADLVLVENDPLDVVLALKLARATYRKMVENLVWATGYNVVAIPLAAGVAYGWGILLNPAVGAIFMSLSTVVVSLNAIALRRAKLA